MAVEITNDGLKIFLDGGVNDDANRSFTPISRLWLGQSQTTPLITSTDLTVPIPISTSTVELVDDCETANWTQGTDSDNETLNSSTFKEGSNALNLGKSGTSGTTMSYSKTTTSVNFTSKKLFVWTYITTLADLVASGTAVTVRFGSDSSNYYYQDVAIGSLSAGWNLIVLDQTSPTGTTGSPTATACDYSYIAFNTDLAADTITLGDVIMDYWHVASSDDFARSFETGYPSGPGDDLQVTLRGEITSGEANGFQINGVAFKNTDSTPLTAMIGSTLVIGKDSSERLIFVGKIRARHKNT